MELDGFNDEIKLPQKGKKKPYEVDFEDLTQQAVEGAMKADVDHIVSLFGVDVRILFLRLSYQLSFLLLYLGARAILSRAIREAETSILASRLFNGTASSELHSFVTLSLFLRSSWSMHNPQVARGKRRERNNSLLHLSPPWGSPYDGTAPRRRISLRCSSPSS